MTSIFSLKTDMSQLEASNPGVSLMSYDEVPATRDITKDNFYGGQIDYRFNVSGQKWWIPSRTYLKARITLSADADGNDALLNENDIALNMGAMANLFQNVEFQIANKKCTRIGEYLAQIDALRTRMYKSKAWLDSVGKMTNSWESSFEERKNKVTEDGKSTVGYQQSASSERTRVELGLDAAGGNGADRNALSYVSATGVFTLAVNGGAALPANTDVLFPVGSFIYYNSIQGATAATDARLGVAIKVLSHPSATTIQGEPLKISNVVDDGRTDFKSVRVYQGNSNSRRVKTFELVWQPPLSIFSVPHAMPAGDYNLLLTPETSSVYMKKAIESAFADKAQTTDFTLSVDSMYLYLAVVDGPRADDVTYLLDLKETACRAENITNASYGSKYFDVNPTTYALTVAYQTTLAGQNSQYSQTKFKLVDNADLNITRQSVEYAHQNKPSFQGDRSFSTGVDLLSQCYVDTLLNTGAYFERGGAETLEEWQERGPYYHYSWPKDGTDKSTRATVFQSFSALSGNDRVLLFDHFRSVARIEVANGRVQSMYVTVE